MSARNIISREFWHLLRSNRNNYDSKSFQTCFQYHKTFATVPFVKDRYDGIHLSIDRQIEKNDFITLLKENLPQWKQTGCTAVWLKIPIEKSGLIPIAAERGFTFHHAEANISMLFLPIASDAKLRIPRFATHQVGVAGCVVRKDTKEVLVVRDKNRPFTFWKFPGGLSELGEDISATAEREVYEETGINSEFKGVLTFRQQHNQPGAFGRSDFYFICHMEPRTFEINPCSHEIEACEWISLQELANSSQNSAITQRVIQLVKLGTENGFDRVNMSSQTFKSVYKGMKYNMFHRVLPEDYKNMKYAYNIAEADRTGDK